MLPRLLGVALALAMLATLAWWGYHVYYAPDPAPEIPEHLRGALVLEAALDPDPPDVETLRRLALRRSAVGYRAALGLGRYYTREEPRQALLYYQSALELHDTREVQLERGRLQQELGFATAARESYRQALPWDEAVEAMEGLELETGELARELGRAHRWDAAVAVLEPHYREDTGLRRLYVQALVHLEQWEAALEAWEPLEAEEVRDDFDTSLAAARAREEMGQEDEALEHYLDLGPEAWHRAGSVLERRDELEEAAYYLGRARDDEARWRGARLWESLEQPRQALGVYLTLAYDTRTSLRQDAAFRALVLLQREDVSAAGGRELRERLLEEPLWAVRLEEEPRWPREEPLPRVEPDFLPRLEAYREHGWQKMEELELAIQSRRAQPAERLALAQWLAEEGDFPRSVQEAEQVLQKQSCPRAWELAYPRVYSAEVEEAAKEFGVDPYLVWAVMREESRFQPRAESGAGARGLMQIMPATAADIAGQKGLDLEDEDLWDPEINVRLGTWYLARLWTQFEGNPDRVLAAYNAGPGNVYRWKEAAPGGEPEDFLVAITYPETRDYVTRVRNTHLYYLWLYQ